MAVNVLDANQIENDELSFTSFTDLCRFCSLRNGPKIHLFEKEAEQRQILYKVRSFLPIAVRRALRLRGHLRVSPESPLTEPFQISKDDFLPKKICERCVFKLEQLYEWKSVCIQSDSVLRNYAESMRAVTATINFQVSVCAFARMCTVH